jgi:hypothetical protein
LKRSRNGISWRDYYTLLPTLALFPPVLAANGDKCPKIEQFFQQSSKRFFGAGLPQEALSVRVLCAELRRIEKSHER